MSKQSIYNYYFGSDIFNIRPKANYLKISKGNTTNSSLNTNYTPYKHTLNTDSNASTCSNTHKPKYNSTHSSKSIEVTTNATDTQHLLHYDPNYYMNRTQFAKEHKERIQKHINTRLKKEKSMDYNAEVVKFRKYGSSIGINAYLYMNTSTNGNAHNNKKKNIPKPKPLYTNKSLSYLGEDINKSPIEFSIKMKQSNIFNNKQKETENSIILNDRVDKVKRPKRSLTQDNTNTREDRNVDNREFHYKLKPIYDKTISKADDIKIIKDYFKNKESSRISNHINNISTLYDKDVYSHLYSKKHEMTDGVIHKYEINRTEDNTTSNTSVIDTKAIQRLFMKRGINAFGAEELGSIDNGKMKCLIRIRTNEDDNNQIENVEKVIKEIESTNKVNISKVKEKSRMSVGKSISMSNSCKSIKDIVSPLLLITKQY